jgi:hypothetical protein
LNILKKRGDVLMPPVDEYSPHNEAKVSGIKSEASTPRLQGFGVSPATSQEAVVNELFTYHPVTSTEQAKRYEAIRDTAKHLAIVILKNTPRSSDQSAAIRKLRECVMTANASIALDGLNL